MAKPHIWAINKVADRIRRFMSKPTSAMDREIECEKCGHIFNVDIAEMFRRKTATATCPKLRCRHENRIPLTKTEQMIEETLGRTGR